MNKDQLPNQRIGDTGDSSTDDNASQRPHDPARRSQNHTQGGSVSRSSDQKDRQPEQTSVPDAELAGD